MFDPRPPLHVVGLLLIFIGVALLVPAATDLAADHSNWTAFLESALLTGLAGGLLTLATANQPRGQLSIRQTFFMTATTWVAIAGFAALPFLIGEPHLSFTDAMFEAVSGITTTGVSVVPKPETMPPGFVLWRGMLNWFGGLGIAFVAMVFFPFLRIGGMKFFSAEGFDTLGKVLPRAGDIAQRLLVVYLGITVLCVTSYLGFGMTVLDAVVNAMATVATGGFSTDDASFGKYHGPIEYVGAFFMILSSLPYIRFVQLMRGSAEPLVRDSQIGVYLAIVTVAVVTVLLWRLATTEVAFEPALRGTLFNLASIISCTGFGTDNVADWGSFAVTVAFIVGLIGGCTSSSSGAISVFRWQILIKAINGAILKVHHPARVAIIRYQGRVVADDVMDPIVMFFTIYILTVGVGSVLIGFTGIDMMSSLFAAWTTIGNIGYGFGDALAPTGTFVAFPTFAKWVMIAIMLLGRLGFVPFFVLFLPRFWRW